MTRAQQRRLHLYAFGLITIALGCLYIWADLWTDLRRYELQNNETVLNTFCTRLAAEAAEGNCEALLSESCYAITYFTVKDAGQHLAHVAAQKEITYQEDEDETDVYHILADGEEIALVRLDIADHFGILGMPSYSIVSLSGVSSARYAVKTPSGVYLGKTGIQALSPVMTNYVPKDLQLLDQSCEELRLPRYLVYEASGLFGIPQLTSGPSSGEAYAMSTIEDGIQLVSASAGATPEEGAEETALSFCRLYAAYMLGENHWDELSPMIYSEAPALTAIQNAAFAAEKTPVEISFDEPQIQTAQVWTDTLVSFRITLTGEARYDDGSLQIARDDTFYLFRASEQDDWLLCELTDNLAEEEPAEHTVKAEPEPLKTN